MNTINYHVNVSQSYVPWYP